MPLAQGAVVIDAGEGEIFEGKVPQPLERRRWGQAPGRDVGEQGLELLGSHATWATGSRYSRKIASASAIDSIWKSRWRSSLAPCRPSGVPAEVLAELDHGLAGVALEPERQPGVLQRHREIAPRRRARRQRLARRAAPARRGRATDCRRRRARS